MTQQHTSRMREDAGHTMGSDEFGHPSRSSVFFSRVTRLAKHSIRAVLDASGVLGADRMIRKTSSGRVCADPANQLFFLFSLPKSAANALRLVLDRCRPEGPQSPGIPRSLYCPNGLHVEIPLTDSVLMDFPDGGWHHSHALGSLITLDFLYRHRVRHVVLVRHPLDQLVAYRCHIVKHRRLGAREVCQWNRAMALTHPQAPVPATAFADDTPLDESFRQMILSGYLTAALNWIGQWCAFRDRKLSLFLTYEELVADPKSVAARVVEFLDPMLAFPERGLDYAVDGLNAYARRSQEIDAAEGVQAYPRGYTGRVGTYEDYLSAENISAARSAIEKFYEQSKYGPLVQAVYPDLLDS